jgi:uncharacterized protein YcfL
MKKIMLLIIAVLLLSGCEKSVNIEKYDMFYMDTYIEVKLYDVLRQTLILLLKR